MKYKELITNELIIFEERLYRVFKSPFSNGKMTGRRVILKLLSQKEITKLVIDILKGEKEVLK